MNAKELKTLLKGLVRECVNEIMNEKLIEMVVENKLKETFKPSINESAKNNVKLLSSQPDPFSELKQELKKKPVEKKPAIPKSFMEGLGIKSPDDPLFSIFEDTAARAGEADKENLRGDNEVLSENEMKAAGILDKDWSRHLESK